MKRKIIVIYVINDLIMGGAEMMLFLLLKYLNREKFDPIVISMHPAGYFSDSISALNIPIHYLNATKKRQFFGAGWRLFKLLKKYQPDILHTHLFESDILGRIIGRLAGVKTIINTVHSQITEYGYLKYADRITQRLVTAYVAISPSTRQITLDNLSINEARVPLIHNAIETDAFAHPRIGREPWLRSVGVSTDSFVIGCVAGLRKEKGHAFLLDALARLKTDIPNVKLILAGTGYLKQELEDKVRELDIQQYVVWLGDRSDIPEMLGACDIVSIPSLYEGLSLVLMEAMASGRAIIASDWPGIRNLVTHDVTAWLVPIGQPQALADATIHLSKHSELRQRLGRSAQLAARQHDVSIMVERYSRLYQDLLSVRRLR